MHQKCLGSEEGSSPAVIASSDLQQPWLSALSTHSYYFISTVRIFGVILILSSWSLVKCGIKNPLLENIQQQNSSFGNVLRYPKCTPGLKTQKMLWKKSKNWLISGQFHECFQCLAGRESGCQGIFRNLRKKALVNTLKANESCISNDEFRKVGEQFKYYQNKCLSCSICSKYGANAASSCFNWENRSAGDCSVFSTASPLIAKTRLFYFIRHEQKGSCFSWARGWGGCRKELWGGTRGCVPGLDPTSAAHQPCQGNPSSSSTSQLFLLLFPHCLVVSSWWQQNVCFPGTHLSFMD